jgi:hypothetical protein
MRVKAIRLKNTATNTEELPQAPWYRKAFMTIFPNLVTPECFNRGSTYAHHDPEPRRMGWGVQIGTRLDSRTLDCQLTSRSKSGNKLSVIQGASLLDS